jgi:xanthine/uracil permease
MFLVFKLAIALVLARIMWKLLPVVVGCVITAILAVLAPVTAIRYIVAKRKAKGEQRRPAAPREPFNAKALVDKYMTEYRKQDGGTT